MSMRECRHCSETRIAALLREGDVWVCRNCSTVWGIRHKRGMCFFCLSENVKIEQHHILGKQVSPVSVYLCANCHAVVTQGRNGKPFLRWMRDLRQSMVSGHRANDMIDFMLMLMAMTAMRDNNTYDVSLIEWEENADE